MVACTALWFQLRFAAVACLQPLANVQQWLFCSDIRNDWLFTIRWRGMDSWYGWFVEQVRDAISGS